MRAVFWGSLVHFGVHFGVIFGSIIGSIFGSIFDQILGPSWGPFWGSFSDRVRINIWTCLLIGFRRLLDCILERFLIFFGLFWKAWRPKSFEKSKKLLKGFRHLCFSLSKRTWNRFVSHLGSFWALLDNKAEFWSNFGSILEPFWASFWGQIWSQNRIKIGSKIWTWIWRPYSGQERSKTKVFVTGAGVGVGTGVKSNLKALNKGVIYM